MKKYTKPIAAAAIALLLILQMVSLWQTKAALSKLEMGMADMRMQTVYGSQELMYTVSTAVDSAINSARLPQEAQLASFKYSFGALDIESMTLPMYIELTPKQLSANTTVSLRIDDVLYEMQRSDTRFTLEHTISAIAGVGGAIEVIIREGEETRSQMEGVYYERNQFVPFVTALALSYSSSSSKGDVTTFRFTEVPYIYSDGSGGTREEEAVQAMRLVFLVDDKLVHEENLDSATVDMRGGYSGESSAGMKYTLKLTRGQTLMIWLQAKDQNGLIHQTLVQSGVLGAQGLDEIAALSAIGSGQMHMLFRENSELLSDTTGFPADYAVLIPW